MIILVIIIINYILLYLFCNIAFQYETALYRQTLPVSDCAFRQPSRPAVQLPESAGKGWFIDLPGDIRRA